MNSFFQSVIITVVLAVLLRFFVIQPFIVDGESMEPNFHNQEYIMIDKLSYRFHPPKRGDVIVFHPPTAPSENYIKRVIGLPGETISFQNNDVYINGKKLDEPYLGSNQDETAPINVTGPITLKANQYFVLGDNREHSSDSREWGILNGSAIEGRTWFVVFPIGDFHFVTTPGYTT